jgi:hypothetical protein
LQLLRIQIDQLLEPKHDDVRVILRLENRREERSVLGRAGEVGRLAAVDIPGAGEEGEVSVTAELGFATEGVGVWRREWGSRESEREDESRKRRGAGKRLTHPFDGEETVPTLDAIVPAP